MDPTATQPKDFVENTLFWINNDFAIVKNGKIQRRGKVCSMLNKIEYNLIWIYDNFFWQVNLIGRLQLSTERSQQEDNQSIVQLRILRTQEAIIKIMKMRKKLNNAALQVCFTFSRALHCDDSAKQTYTLTIFVFSLTSKQVELIDILKNMFLPSKKMIKEQLEWLIEHKYMRRDDDDINTFIYMA